MELLFFYFIYRKVISRMAFEKSILLSSSCAESQGLAAVDLQLVLFLLLCFRNAPGQTESDSCFHVVHTVHFYLFTFCVMYVFFSLLFCTADKIQLPGSYVFNELSFHLQLIQFSFVSFLS